LFYHFSQNNSGGSFDYDERDGITHHVVIEADSPEEANRKAESIGIYFYGCDDGRDCSCCGDRWYPTDNYDAKEEPEIFGKPVHRAHIKENEEDFVPMKWIDGYEIFVHYKDGRVEGFYQDRQ
jgi:hypothetical protein